MSRRVVVTGTGVLSPIGNSNHAFLNALKNGENGIGTITSFDTIDFSVHIAGELKINFEDYFEDSNGLHIQAGIQVKILILNTFINARYTFITKDNSPIDRQGFMNILFGVALGI